MFLILGWYAALAALDQGGAPVDSSGALRSLLDSALGWLIALLILGGLLCFAIFRIVEASLDVHSYGNDLSGTLRRAALGAAGLAYAGLTMTSSSIVFGWKAAQSSDQSARDWTAWLLSLPGGDWIVGVAGLAVVGIGIGLAIRGFRATFKRRVQLDTRSRPYVTALGRIGFIARSVVFLLMGAFLVFAAITADPQNAQGFSGALRTLQAQPYGNFLLGLTALGLLAFGSFGIGEAIFADVKQQRQVSDAERTTGSEWGSAHI